MLNKVGAKETTWIWLKNSTFTALIRMLGVVVIFKIIFRVESFLAKVTLESLNQRRVDTALLIHITSVLRWHFLATHMAWYNPDIVLDRGHGQERCWGCFPDSLSWWKLMWFSCVNLQTGLRFERIITLVTLKSCTLTGWFLVNWNLLLLMCRFALFLQELCPALRIPSEGWGAGLLLGWWIQDFLTPGVQSEGEGWANVEGELDNLALAGQCLAECHALCCQGGVIFTNSSHFGLLPN